MKTTRQVHTLLAAIFLCPLVFSCSGGSYTEVFDLPHAEWPSGSAVNFEFIPTDHSSAKNIDIIVRYSRDFPTANLLLEVKTVRPDEIFWCDTISVPLVDEKGKPAGAPISIGNDIKYNYRTGAVFSKEGQYAIALRQLTGQDTLRHILSVGVNIYPAD